MFALVALGAAACGSRGPSSHVIIDAFAGTAVEPGALVVAHDPSGNLVDVQVADATGRAQLGIDDDSLVSVLFPAGISPTTPHISVITTVPPTDGSELFVYGPASGTTPPLVVGVLDLDGPNLNSADYFDVTLGCATIRVTKLPATINVGACSMGTDQNLDVLVRGYHDVTAGPQLDGYGAGRVAMVDGVATLRVASWQTTGPAVSLTFDGVQAFANWTMHVDTLPFVDEPVTASSHAYTGLMVDTTTVTGTVPAANGARITTRDVMGTPSTIAFADSDFLPSLASVPVVRSTDPATIAFDAADIGADAVNVHATWNVGPAVSGLSGVVPPGPHLVLWEAVLPTTATSVTLPIIGDDILAEAITPDAIVASDVLLRHIESPDVDGFAALRAAGLHVEDARLTNRIVAIPAMGQVRVAQTIGTQ